MNEITQIRRLSLWIFFIPLIAINLCLLISQNYELLEEHFFYSRPDWEVIIFNTILRWKFIN